MTLLQKVTDDVAAEDEADEGYAACVAIIVLMLSPGQSHVYAYGACAGGIG